MRRRKVATALSIAPQPSDNVSEAFSAIEARRKLEVSIEDQKSKAEVAQTDYARSFVRGLQLIPTVDAETAFQKNEAWKVAQARAQQRIEALENLLEAVNKFIEQLKYDSPEAVNVALTRKVEALEKTLSEREEDGKDLEDQIKKLKAEINKLPKTAAKKAAG
jgi:chaperonin cofactor prefoldin